LGSIGLRGTMCQPDFQGRRIFQHRNFDKWRFDGRNRRIPGFLHEGLCLRFIKELRERYTGRVENAAVADVPMDGDRGDSAPEESVHVASAFGETTGSNITGGCVAAFKMFGLQRTCTNVVRRALLDNFESESLEEGAEWRHGPIGEIAWRERRGQLARVVVCVRNPYAWLVSCFAYFCRYFGREDTICPSFSPGMSFADFVHGGHYRWPSPVDRWNEMNQHWESFVAAHPLRAAVVRAEDLLGIEDQIRQWTRLEVSLGLVRKVDPADGAPRPLIGVRRRVNYLGQATGKEMDFDYFRRERYLAKFDGELLRTVNDRLDWRLMELFGYDRRGIGA
jgi:hypothetical protein